MSSSSGRAARRRQERAEAKKPKVLLVGDGIVATEMGQKYEALPHADLAPKQPGVHRWIATGAWVLSPDQVAGVMDPDQLKFLDHENLMELAVGCWDCEQPLGAIQVGSVCPAPAAT